MNFQAARGGGWRRRVLGLVSGVLMIALYAAIVLGAAGDTTADRVLGQGDFTQGGINMMDAQSLNLPVGVAIDTSTTPNHVYVADSSNNRVLGWNDVTSLTNGAYADLVIGEPDFLSNIGGTSAALLNTPYGVAVDSSGNLYVADTVNHRVLEFDNPFSACGGVFPCVGGSAHLVFGQGGSFTTRIPNNGGVSANSLWMPFAVAVDSSGNLYVADTFNQRVLEYDTPITTDTTADKVFGQFGFFTINACNQSGESASSLCNPEGVAVDGSGNVYVADYSNDRVLEYNTPLTTDTTADIVFGVCGQDFTGSLCSSGPAANSMDGPKEVAVDGSGNLYVADSFWERVLEFTAPLTPNTTADTVFGQGGSFTSVGCNSDTGGGNPTANGLCITDASNIGGGIAVDGSGNVYIADTNNNRVLQYYTPLTTDTTADVELGQGDFLRNYPNAVHAEGLDGPQAVAIDTSTTPNRVYVADYNNSRVLGWKNAATFTNGAKADLVIGQPDFLSFTCNYGGVTASGLCDPDGVAVDSSGNLYVADYNNSRVLEYTNPFTACGGVFPCVGGSAHLVFGQGNSFTSEGCNFDTSDGSSTAIDLCNPQAVKVDGSGNLWVADTGNSRVVEYTAPLTPNTTADTVVGQGNDFTSNVCDYDTDGSSATAIDLCYPTGAAVDSSGNLYVADNGNSRVLEYNTPLTTDTIADEVFGQYSDFTFTGCNSGDAYSLCDPSDAALDGLGNLYVTDSGNSRALEYTSPLTNTTANKVFGQGGDFTASGCNSDTFGFAPTANDLCDPIGIAVDGSNNLYVADTNNNRVLEFDQPLASPSPTPTATSALTATPTPTATRTPTPSATRTATTSTTPTSTTTTATTATRTATATVSPTATATRTATPTPTATATATATKTTTPTTTATPTATVTISVTRTATPTATASPTITATPTPTCTVSVDVATSIMDFAVAPDDGSFVPSRSVTFTNLSSCAVPMSADIEGISPGEYGLVGDTCHSSLAPAPATCKYTVAFTADGVGEFDADLIVTVTGDQNSPYDVTLTGQGSAP